jgi:hypothetical protein
MSEPRICHAGFKFYGFDPCPECGAKANETCGRVHIVLEAELAQLRFENKWLREANRGFEAENKQLREDKFMLERQVLRLRNPPEPFV